MNAAKHVTHRLWLGGLVLAAVALTHPPQCRAGRDTKELPVSVRLVLMEVSHLMDQEEYGQAVDRIIAFRSNNGKAAIHGPDSEVHGHPILCFALGNCYLLQANYIQAKAAYSEALKRDPDYTEACLNLAKTCYELKDYAEAAKCYAHAYALSDQGNPDYLYFSAVGYLMAEDYGPAITAFERLFKVHADRIQQQWQENYAHALLVTNEPRRALPIIKDLAHQTEGDRKARWQETLLHLYLQLDMTAQALSYATALTREDCTMARWWKALAHVHLSLGHYKEALAGLTIYGYLTPFTAEERKLWADLNLQLNIPVRAAAVYEAMMTEKPEKRLLQNLVTAYQMLNRPDKALEQLTHFHSQVTGPELWMLKGDLLYTLKRFNDANNAYRRAAKANDRQAGQAWLLAGYAAWQTNDLSASRRAFEHAATYQGQRKAALTAMAQIKR